MRGPSEGLHEGPALGRGGRRKGATPQPMAGPRGRDCHAAPPLAVRRRRQGTRGPPPLPPPPPTQAREQAGGRPPHPPPRTPPSWGATGAALRPPGAEGTPPPPPPPEGTATRWGERRLDLLPRTHTSVPEQRAQQNSMEAAPHMTRP